jgi:hypothetical protein
MQPWQLRPGEDSICSRYPIIATRMPRLPRKVTKRRRITASVVNFWSYVNKRGPDDCWYWTKSTTGGYGVVPGAYLYAHQIAYKLSKGNVPVGRVVMHKCDHRSCCNPRHLILGTQKGRSTAHLTPDQVRAIRLDIAAGLTRKIIAARYGTSEAVVGDIKFKRSYAWIE